ncbi:MAG: AAA family ATPase [Candidatus Lokiarchaeota archaeon]|nr:AAA family ATPase [Candidatus Lokiarchaeota archaeon]MBD3339423.1 AAA family ATPase [Candidatus Lokiarchaeota archaeon]
MKNKPMRIAITGKGGVGKTVITALLAKYFSEETDYNILLIDADPTHPHLCNLVELEPSKSLERIRSELVKKASTSGENLGSIANKIDFEVYNTMGQDKRLNIFYIGQPEGPGCFCPSNLILRRVLKSISSDFDIILVDCEAGLEQINRMVLHTVDIILIVCDLSLRSIYTAVSIMKKADKFTNYKKIGVIINKAKGNIDTLINKVRDLGLDIFGIIPEDHIISDYDLKGKPVINVEDFAQSVKAIEKIAKNIL